MKVKRFVANTEAEALAAVRLDLGPNAVILDTKKVKAGIAGILSGGAVEVLAAVEEQPPVQPAYGQKHADPGRSHKTHGKSQVAAVTALLLQQGVDPALAFDVSEKLDAGSPDGGLAQAIDGLMARSVMRPVYQRGSRVALVGPTGSGKTTTAAKICAVAALKCRLRVLWVAADTYRVGGVEQASTYAEIMGVPLEVCATPGAVASTIEAHSEAEFVLLDTTGRSHLAHDQVAVLGDVVAASKATDIYLTVPAATGWVQAQEVLEGFLPTRYNRLIITKLDEATKAGTILNLAGLCRTPMAYFTTGQTVPDDLSPAGPELIREIMKRGRKM